MTRPDPMLSERVDEALAEGGRDLQELFWRSRDPFPPANEARKADNTPYYPGIEETT